MSDKPILFSGPMVRALLAGTKTQTRRAIKWQGPKGYPHSFEHAVVDNPAGVQRLLVPYRHPDDPATKWGEDGYHRHYSIADPGDRFWVKETWSHSGDGVFEISQARRALNGRVIYRADDDPEFPHAKWWPSIFMPREFSRTTLHVTDVRVQRLQDISEGDALAEGMTDETAAAIMSPDEAAVFASVHILAPHASGRILYETVWERINGAGSWAKNPWVAAYTFTVELKNIDQVEAA